MEKIHDDQVCAQELYIGLKAIQLAFRNLSNGNGEPISDEQDIVAVSHSGELNYFTEKELHSVDEQSGFKRDGKKFVCWAGLESPNQSVISALTDALLTRFGLYP